jgi:hypothetical protein
MRVNILSEFGETSALYGLGLSYGLTSNISFYEFSEDMVLYNKVRNVALKLYKKEDGHNKFLESIGIFLDITAPRFFWSEFDTYRIGTTKQSESTMHTIFKNNLTQENFEYVIDDNYLDYLNSLIVNKEKVEVIKNSLPEGFLQKRIVSTNYKVLRNILKQRKNHKLPQWDYFCLEIYRKCEYPEYFQDIMEEK